MIVVAVGDDHGIEPVNALMPENGRHHAIANVE